MLGKIVACRRFSWNVFRIHLKITKIIKEYLQIQMLYVFLNITPWLDLMKLLILVYKKPLKILIWLLETDDFVSINQRQSAVMVEFLDIVHQRLKFWLTLVKTVVFWTIWRRNNHFLCIIADGSPPCSPCYLWYSNKISTLVTKCQDSDGNY